MIADWPTEMAIFASDPQQKGAQASRGQLLEHNHVLKFAVQLCQTSSNEVNDRLMYR
jgi:hypothetical protein